ncbi:MAG: acetolactate synthase small subunit [Bacillus thermozeamaize]|jgi:acetolactate synthase-1/3 small subunit|uniref:Acetolactate synthase small subunit n=1 Tax=Bacillus thermozeamaize TaxID=230954 RepID=A0A1Y3PLF8_9BACI|nr:MAG: acetolactate synthase small subunit [Bacillus thermozeamaize]
MSNQQTHTISILVNDEPGVLARVAGLFGRRGYNIDSITVGGSEEPGLSRMIIVTRGDEHTIEQITKQLNKLIDVIKVQVLSDQAMVARELALIKVNVNPANRAEISGIIEPFRASVIDVGQTSLIIQVTGDQNKVNALIQLLKPYGIKEICRTGVSAMARGLAMVAVK